MCRRAIDAGHIDSLNAMALILQQGHDRVEKNVHEAVRLYNISLDAGHTNAIFNLALIGKNGCGYEEVKMDVPRVASILLNITH